MAELDKVIKGFECCINVDNACPDCPYDYEGECGENVCLRERLIPYALELLKEQQKKIKSLEQTIEDICCG